jgi:hypothetical protein
MLKPRPFILRSTLLLLCCVLCATGALERQAAHAQQPQPSATTQSSSPLTSAELVRMVRELPSRPALRDAIVSEIRRRGIGFPLTNGMLSVVATKSGNDVLLRRTLEEAERRRLNPATAKLPSEREGREVLSRVREATLAAAERMPDFVVKDQIIRSYARGTTKNWRVDDRLTVAVSYRAGGGEKYNLLAVNGQPTATAAAESDRIDVQGGATSTGEYVTRLTGIFQDESQTDFQLVDTDTLRGRRCIVYEYQIKKANSRAVLTYNNEQQTSVGDRGRIWVDRETFRVLRLESISTEIPAGFPVSAASRSIDYDWVTIAERQYLLPSRAIVELTATTLDQTYQSRNDVRFRNYQKYGTEIKIIEEDIFEEDVPQKP